MAGGRRTSGELVSDRHEYPTGTTEILRLDSWYGETMRDIHSNECQHPEECSKSVGLQTEECDRLQRRSVTKKISASFKKVKIYLLERR